MKHLLRFVSSLPFSVVLGGVIISVTAILSQYPGAIDIHWGLDGGSFRIEGVPATDVHQMDIEPSKPEAREH